MKIKALKLIAYFLIGFLLVPLATVKASTADDIQRQIDANRALLNQKSQEASSLSNQVAIFDAQILDAELQISKTQASIDQNQAEIVSLQAQITQKEQEIEIQKQNLFETMRVLYESGQNQGMVEIVVGANSFSDAMNQTQYLESLSTKINDSYENIKKLKAELEIKKQDQEKKKKDSEDLLVEQQGYRNSLDGQRAAKAQLLDQTQGQESQYQAKVAQLQQELNAIYSRGGRGAPVGSQLISSIDYSWYYNQNSYPNVYLGGSGLTIAQAGCLITSIAMIATKYGHSITPPGVVDASYFTGEGGWAGFSRPIGISVGSSQPVNWNRVNSELNAGHPVIASVYVGGPRYNSDGSNHFIVLKGISNGRYLIHDPYWSNSSYDVSDVISMKIVSD